MGPEALGEREGGGLTAGALFSLYPTAPLPAQHAESSGLCPFGIVLELAWEQRQADTEETPLNPFAPTGESPAQEPARDVLLRSGLVDFLEKASWLPRGPPGEVASV